MKQTRYILVDNWNITLLRWRTQLEGFPKCTFDTQSHVLHFPATNLVPNSVFCACCSTRLNFGSIVKYLITSASNLKYANIPLLVHDSELSILTAKRNLICVQRQKFIFLYTCGVMYPTPFNVQHCPMTL